MKRLSWKYIAGFIDGEGCLDIQASKDDYIVPRLRIALAEAGKDVLDILCTNHGGSICKRVSNNTNWSDSYSWEITGYTRVCMVLRNLVNALIIKKEQARFILWCETNLKGLRLTKEVRQRAIDELKAMKRDPHRLSEKAQEEILAMR